MDPKTEYTKKFLSAAGIEVTDQIVESKRSEWWYNFRKKNDGGLRLTDQALEFIQNNSKIKTYNIKFPGQFTITPQILVWLDKFIDSPYYITKKDITVTSEKTAFELYLFSGDVRKMGYSKALSKRLSQESADQE
jgi:hypothetical protein